MLAESHKPLFAGKSVRIEQNFKKVFWISARKSLRTFQRSMAIEISVFINPTIYQTRALRGVRGKTRSYKGRLHKQRHCSASSVLSNLK